MTHARPAAPCSADVDARMAQIFHAHRMPRSCEYKAGVRAMLECSEDGVLYTYPPCPFDIGTPQADAWFAGAGEARVILRDGQ